MNEDLERKLLIDEILILEASVVDSGNIPLTAEALQELPTADLRASKQRFERLVRSLGGVKR